MRVTGGSLSGRQLKVPAGLDVRPTPDLVKQAIFNSLGEVVQGARVLELFAGSGSLSIECLSRGATHATCVEKSSRHARYIRENFEALGIEHARFFVRVGDALASAQHFKAAAVRFDLILADPPYGEKNVGKRSRSFAQKLLDQADLSEILSPTGLLILGHTKRDTLELPAWWREAKQLKHGDTIMRFLAPVSQQLSDNPGVELASPRE